MALPGSGQLGLGAIAGELGVSLSNVSLRSISSTAGFSTPDYVSEFYGYSAATGYSYTTSTISFPSTSGYTLYNGGWEFAGSYPAEPDDDYTFDPILLDTTFYLNGGGSSNLYVNSNGWVSLSYGWSDIETTPVTYGLGGYWEDTRIYEGQPVGVNTQGVYYDVGSDSNGSYIKLIVHCVTYSGEYDCSWMLNWYRDSSYQYAVTRLLLTDPLGGVFTGPNLITPEYSSTTSKVFRSELDGTGWTYLGTGNVV